MSIASIREARTAKVAEARSIVNAANGGNLTPEQQTKFDALKVEITNLEGQEARQQFLDEAERRSQGEVVAGDQPFDKLKGDVQVLDVIRAQVEGRSLDGAAREYNTEVERRTGRKAQGAFVPLETRVNTTTTAPDIVPTIHRPDQYIDALRQSLVARSLGVRTLSGLSGNLSIPKYGSGTTVGWVAENTAVPEGDMTFASVGLTPKHVGGKTEMSRQLIQQSSPDIEQLVRGDIGFMIAKAIDQAILAGDGTGATPLGVLNLPGIQTGDLSTLNWANVLAFAQQLEDEEIFGGTWLTTATAKTKLASTLKEAGLAGYLLDGTTMANRPLVTSKHVGEDSSGNQTILLGDFSQILLGVWSELDILVNPYAEPAYSRGGVVIRAMATVGTACRYEQAFVKGTLA